jgi:hypothetical protein
MVVTGGISIATLTGSALAQSSHGHEHQHTEGPRGGQIAEVGPYDAEIVLEDGEIRVYLMTHEDPPTAVAASSGDIVVIAGGGSKKIVLSQDGEALVGKPDFEIQDGTKAVIRVKTADGKTHAGKAEIETD